MGTNPKNQGNGVLSNCPSCHPICKRTDIKSMVVCEHQESQLRCEAGESVNVKEAWYGRKSEKICPHKSAKNNDCSSKPAVTLAAIKKVCQGRLYCLISPSQLKLGDPCRGTSKYLSLSYECEKGK